MGRGGRGDLSHAEVGSGAVGEEGDVAGVEERASGVVVDGRLEEELAVGVVAGLLGAPRLLLPLARLHLAPHSAGPGRWDGARLRRRGMCSRRFGGARGGAVTRRRLDESLAWSSGASVARILFLPSGPWDW